MTHHLPAAGHSAVPGELLPADAIDQALDALWALAAYDATAEPFAFLVNDPGLRAMIEIKQARLPDAGDQEDDQEGNQEPRSVKGSEPAPVADSTRAMLVQMRAVLDREAARLGEDGVEGKAAVDQVALIARTLEKIDQMERLIAEDQARLRSQTLSIEEREQMRQTVRQLILAAAERMVAERRAEDGASGQAG
jgi:hypothetical protein